MESVQTNQSQRRSEEVKGFDEKLQAILSVLNQQERAAMIERVENPNLSTAVGNEGIALLLIESIWMKETEEGKAFYRKLQASLNSGEPL